MDRDSIPPEALLETLPPPIAEAGARLRRLVRAAHPDAIERVRPGWRLIGYDLIAEPRGKPRFFAWIWPEVKHVHLGFQDGVLIDDPEQVLRGAGITKRVRWLTYGPGDCIDEATARGFLKQAADIARLERDERFARILDVDARTPPARSNTGATR